jgi:hypothetical protein
MSSSTLEARDVLAGRVAEHVVAVALVRKSPEDPAPFAVWWRVTDALRASTQADPATAVAEVDAALAAVHESVHGRLPTPASDGFAARPTDPARALAQAQTLVARLVLGRTATSPTLLHVRLARLRRALVAVAEQA